MMFKRAVNIAMAKKGINQSELARRLGLAASTVSKQMNKEVASMTFINMVANELGMKISELIALGEDN